MQKAGFARRISTLTPFKVVDFLEAALKMQAAGQDIIRLETGEPGFATPRPVRQAAIEALEDDLTRYTPSFGIEALRQAIADFYCHRYGLQLASERIIVTTGSSAALGMICDLLLDPGDSMLLPDPGYPCNANFVRRADAEPLRVPVTAEQGYRLTPASLASHWRSRTKGVLVASPDNPTGRVLDRGDLASLHGEVQRRSGALIVDEIYHGLVYPEAETTSILHLTDDAYVINSFSKYFGMTGWRLGWMVVPEAALRPLQLMTQNFYISPPTVAQHAALACFKPDCLAVFEERRQELCRRRDFLVPALRQLGFHIPNMPAGAFYIYAGIGALGDDSEKFCWDMLHRAGVAITPGTDFGEYQARSHVRFAYTQPLDRLQQAVDRMARVLKS